MSRDPSPFLTILVPVDGSPLAERAVGLAADIARASGSKLRLALVHQVPSAPLDPSAAKLFTSMELASRKSERAYLRGLQTRLRQQGVRLASAVTLTGAVGPALGRYVRELGVDLIVMATHGRGGLRRAWLGSVADHLVRHLEIPLLLVRPGESEAGAPASGRQILVPLDGSPLAEEALDPAVALAALWQAELLLLQVVPPVLRTIDAAVPMPSVYDEGLTAACRSQAQDYLDDITGELRARGIGASGAAVVGWNPVDTILDVARPEQVALVAIATHGRGGVRRWALGSVADKLVRGADVPILVRRPAGRRKTKGRAAASPPRGRKEEPITYGGRR